MNQFQVDKIYDILTILHISLCLACFPGKRKQSIYANIVVVDNHERVSERMSERGRAREEGREGKGERERE